MMGFTFNNVHSSFFGVIMKSVDRSLLPGLRKNEFIIPGRHGAIDYGLNAYDKRVITVDCGFKASSIPDARGKARDVSKWLSGSGLLVFDDEPNKAYQAKLYDAVSLEPQMRIGRFTLDFECQPFAESLAYKQINTDITDNNEEVELTVAGTSETGCIITIKNNGNNTISGITIRRKAAI